MTVPYRRYAVGARTVFRPVLTIEMERSGRIIQLDALVDSGADVTLFPAEVATFLGARLRGNTARTVLAAGGQVLRVRFARIILRLPDGGTLWAWRARVGFTEDIKHVVLGQEGFLEHFRACLDRRRRVLDVTPGPQVQRC